MVRIYCCKTVASHRDLHLQIMLKFGARSYKLKIIDTVFNRLVDMASLDEIVDKSVLKVVEVTVPTVPTVEFLREFNKRMKMRKV